MSGSITFPLLVLYVLAVYETGSAKPTLTNAPSEVILEILSRLDPVSSVCLGLNCKQLYNIHWDLNGKVKIGNVLVIISYASEFPCSIFQTLRDKLANWMQTRDYLFTALNDFNSFGSNGVASGRVKSLRMSWNKQIFWLSTTSPNTSRSTAGRSR